MQMLKEILEEADVVKRTYESIRKNLDEISGKILDSKKIYIMGDGTSYHSSLYLENLLNRFHLNSWAIPSTEISHHIQKIKENDICIFFSQSGENLDTLNAAKLCLDKKSTIISIVNNNDSSLTNISHISAYLNSGKEIAIPATKSYISMLTFSYALYKYLKNESVQIDDISKKIKTILSLDNEIEKFSKNLKDYVFILGTGINFITTMEASLKLIETARITSIPFYLNEVFHGPIQIFEEKSTIIILKDVNVDNESIKKIEKYTKTIKFGSEDSDLYLPNTEYELFPMVYIIPFQFLSYYAAKLRGLNPDFPERLKKFF
ncbi:MAG: SIS domain-containing protein [Thermoplasmata archaeon]